MNPQLAEFATLVLSVLVSGLLTLLSQLAYKARLWFDDKRKVIAEQIERERAMRSTLENDLIDAVSAVVVREVEHKRIKEKLLLEAEDAYNYALNRAESLLEERGIKIPVTKLGSYILSALQLGVHKTPLRLDAVAGRIEHGNTSG